MSHLGGNLGIYLGNMSQNSLKTTKYYNVGFLFPSYVFTKWTPKNLHPFCAFFLSYATNIFLTHTNLGIPLTKQSLPSSTL